MADLLAMRTAPILAVLTEADTPLRLSEIARLAQAPLSSAQRVIDGLMRDGMVVRVSGSRPSYALAPSVPRAALASLADWSLGQAAAATIRQRVAALHPVATAAGVEEITARALDDPELADRLREMAKRLIWWQSPQESVAQPTRLLLQVMALGTWEDATLVSELYGDDVLRGVLAVASAGIVGPAAWQYWHRRLGYMNPPPMPTRVLA